jgi:putative spermidine/putrescine transport system permease protein/spermidine/putrescine transport system permease protein
LPLVYNFTGALIGMVHYMLPLFVLPVYAAMRDIDVNIVRAAASMGAGFWHCVRTIILPLSLSGVLSGATIVFIYTLGFFITPAVLGGGKVNPVSIRIERTLSAFQDWGGAAALGILLLVLVLLFGGMIFGVRHLTTRRHGHA